MDEKKTRNKLSTDGENKEATTFRRYSPQLDKVIEAENIEEWEKKVKQLLLAKSND